MHTDWENIIWWLTQSFFCGKLIESWEYFDGLVQDSSNTIINALELLQSCTIDLILKYLINELKKGEELQIPLMN